VTLTPGGRAGCTFVNTAFDPDLSATLDVTKTVVGTVPVDDWAFNGTGLVGDFALPGEGGSLSFIVPAGTYAITETVVAGYSAAAACTTGAQGSHSVTVTLSPADRIGCIFTNTESSANSALFLPLLEKTAGAVEGNVIGNVRPLYLPALRR
jgi:hypothetical protein